MPLPFVGPTYSLRSVVADIQRTVGMIPTPLEPGNERTQWVFNDCPGLVEFSNLAGEVRGLWRVDSRVFAVAGNTAYELSADGASVALFTMGSSVGLVGMTNNNDQLIVSDGEYMYIMKLSDNTMQQVFFPGKARIDYLNQRVVFVHRDSQVFGWTDLGAAEDIGALSFASAEASPDKLTALVVNHLEVFLFGTETGEPWNNVTGETIFERNTGGVFEVGSPAEFSAQKMDGTIYWLSSDRTGDGAVYRLQGYMPQKISTVALEQLLAGKDLANATAYSYTDERSWFYVLTVPGLDTTWVYDSFSGQWHERAEWIDGNYKPYRGTTHLMAFGYHLIGAKDGKVYRMDHNAHTNAGDILIRERIMPTDAMPNRTRGHYRTFHLDCERGSGGTVMMRYSINGGRSWTAWKHRSLGELGVYNRSVKWDRLAAGKDYVFHVRCTDNVPFNPVNGGAE